jgi:hypothetical protein
LSYSDIAKVYASSGLRERVTMAAATQPSISDPQQWMSVQWMKVAASPGWGDAWASGAVTYPDSPDIGALDDVITDGMILAAVQALL